MGVRLGKKPNPEIPSSFNLKSEKKNNCSLVLKHIKNTLRGITYFE